MAISISNQRISHQRPLPKLEKRFGGSLLDVVIVGCLILIVPPLSLLAFLITPLLSFLVKQSVKRDGAANSQSDLRESSD